MQRGLAGNGVPSQKNADAAAAGITARGNEDNMPVNDAPVRRPDSAEPDSIGPDSIGRVTGGSNDPAQADTIFFDGALRANEALLTVGEARNAQ
jgi:hypothetical protein